MNLRESDVVSAVALVVESETSTTAAVVDEELPIVIGLDDDTPPEGEEDV
jgi:DNA gyrase subunit A